MNPEILILDEPTAGLDPLGRDELLATLAKLRRERNLTILLVSHSMEDLAEHLVRWGIHPDQLVTHTFPLEKADEAYALMASGECGKVAITFPEED